MIVTPPIEDAYRCGGYYLTRFFDRSAYMSGDLLPMRLLSASACLANFIPDDWAMEWCRRPDTDRVATSREFGVGPDALSSISDWATKNLVDGGAFGWPNVFPRWEDAIQFATLFLKPDPDLILIGLGLHESFSALFLEETRCTSEDSLPLGLFLGINSAARLRPGGFILRWEVLGYNACIFHSWLCNGLEKNVDAHFGIRPGRYGLIQSETDAVRAAEFCGREETGAEEGLWLPWLVVQYPIEWGPS